MIELEYNLMLAELAGKSRETLAIGASLTLPELEARLGFPPDSVGMLLLNGVWAPLESVIRVGDFVELYPHLEGGLPCPRRLPPAPPGGGGSRCAWAKEPTE